MTRDADLSSDLLRRGFWNTRRSCLSLNLTSDPSTPVGSTRPPAPRLRSARGGALRSPPLRFLRLPQTPSTRNASRLPHRYGPVWRSPRDLNLCYSEDAEAPASSNDAGVCCDGSAPVRSRAVGFVGRNRHGRPPDRVFSQRPALDGRLAAWLDGSGWLCLHTWFESDLSGWSPGGPCVGRGTDMRTQGVGIVVR
jgi:hypothetical protein